MEGWPCTREWKSLLNRGYTFLPTFPLLGLGCNRQAWDFSKISMNEQMPDNQGWNGRPLGRNCRRTLLTQLTDLTLASFGYKMTAHNLDLFLSCSTAVILFGFREFYKIISLFPDSYESSFSHGSLLMVNSPSHGIFSSVVWLTSLCSSLRSYYQWSLRSRQNQMRDSRSLVTNN